MGGQFGQHGVLQGAGGLAPVLQQGDLGRAVPGDHRGHDARDPDHRAADRPGPQRDPVGGGEQQGHRERQHPHPRGLPSTAADPRQGRGMASVPAMLAY